MKPVALIPQNHRTPYDWIAGFYVLSNAYRMFLASSETHHKTERLG